MRIVYTKIAREQLIEIKKYIALDNEYAAIKHLQEIKKRLEILRSFPYIGKVNHVFNKHEVRELKPFKQIRILSKITLKANVPFICIQFI